MVAYCTFPWNFAPSTNTSTVATSGEASTMRMNDGLAAEAGSARIPRRANKARRPTAKAARQSKQVSTCLRFITVSSFSRHHLLSVPHIHVFAHLRDTGTSARTIGQLRYLAPQVAVDGSEHAKHG